MIGNKEYTPEEIQAARASQVAHGLQMMARSPNDPKVRELAGKIMQADPTILLDAVESRKNPIVF